MDFQNNMASFQAAIIPKAVPPTKPGIATDLDVSIKRLYELCSQLESVGDSIGGPVPQNAINGEAGARPMANIASRSRDISDLITRALTSVERISNAI